MNGFDEMTQTYNGIPIENLLDPHPVRKAAPVTDHSDYPTKHIMQFFEYDHLPPNLARVSQPFCELAKLLTDPDGIVGYDLTLPCNPERTVALRKLLEAKDAAVRALQSFVAETMRLEREKKEALVSTEDAIDLVDRAKKLSPAALDRWLIMINKERIHGMTKIRFDIVKKQLEEIEKSQ